MAAATGSAVPSAKSSAPPAPPPAPAAYTVVGGDTLWGIAERVYGDGLKWRQIYDANRGAIGDDPGLLKIGTTLAVPPK